MPQTLRPLVLLAVLLAVAPSGAQYLTGRALLDLCARHGREDPGETEAQLVQDLSATGTCRGYLMGVTDRLEDETGACVPAGTTVAALINALQGYAERHPDELHRPASGIVVGALRRAYPCRPSEPPARPH